MCVVVRMFSFAVKLVLTLRQAQEMRHLSTPRANWVEKEFAQQLACHALMVSQMSAASAAPTVVTSRKIAFVCRKEF